MNDTVYWLIWKISLFYFAEIGYKFFNWLVVHRAGTVTQKGRHILASRCEARAYSVIC